jgi:hypothetical protein
MNVSARTVNGNAVVSTCRQPRASFGFAQDARRQQQVFALKG